MTLMQIISAALQQLGYATDAQTQKVWRDKFTQLANEGMLDLGEAIKLRRTDSIPVTGGEINLDDLPFECVKVRGVSQNGADVSYSRGSATGKLAVSATGEVSVEYQYVPAAMSYDTDKPGIPERLHNLLVTYICACHHMGANVDTQNRYNPLYSKYLSGRAAAKRYYDEPIGHSIINKGW